MSYIKGAPLVSSMGRIGRDFFVRSSPRVARSLLGQVLVRMENGQRLAGIIVETEAYRGLFDPASHAYQGMTKRNKVMFGEAGHAYVYLSYGVHQCLNITTERPGIPAAVLIRALEPIEGIETMKKRRNTQRIQELTSGPGKLTKALGISLDFNGEDLAKSKTLFLEGGKSNGTVKSSTRIGISAGKNRRWRFFFDGNYFVSHRKPP